MSFRKRDRSNDYDDEPLEKVLAPVKKKKEYDDYDSSDDEYERDIVVDDENEIDLENIKSIKKSVKSREDDHFIKKDNKEDTKDKKITVMSVDDYVKQSKDPYAAYKEIGNIAVGGLSLFCTSYAFYSFFKKLNKWANEMYEEKYGEEQEEDNSDGDCDDVPDYIENETKLDVSEKEKEKMIDVNTNTLSKLSALLPYKKEFIIIE